jgi:hypothetical protein
MPHLNKKLLVRSAVLPAVALLAVSGSAAAFAAEPGAAARSAIRASSGLYYTMHLSSASATVQPGGTTTTVISFKASRRLYGAPVDLSVSGLPEGATASFSPQRPLVGGRSTLTITTSPSSPAGDFAITVGAIINLESSDPIGTTAPFALTVR